MSEPGMGADASPDAGALAGRGQDAAAEGRHLARASATVFGFGLVWKGLGFFREAVAGALFGANRAMDAFVVAKSIPDMFSTWIEAPLRAAIVPIFSRRRHQQGEQAAWDAASNILNTLVVGLAGLTAVLFVASPLLVRTLSTGFRETGVWEESSAMARVLTLSILFSVIAVVLGSLSNLHGRQAVPALGRNVNALVVLGAVVILGPRLGVMGYAWAILLGSVAYFVSQLDVLWRHRRQYRLVLRPAAPEIREVIAIGFPLFIGLTGTRIDVLIDRNFASFLPAGSLSVLTYATLLSAMVTDIVVTVATSVLLPHFSQLAAQERHAELRSRMVKAIAGYVFLMVPVTVFLTTAARPFVHLVYGRGRFEADALDLTALVLIILALADPFFGVGQVFAQAHIGHGDTRTPMYVGFWRIGFKAACSAVLVPLIGIFGLAAASALSSVFRTVALWRRLPDAVRPTVAELLRPLTPTAVPALIAIASSLAVQYLVPLPAAFEALAAGAASATAFLAAAVLLGHWMVRDLRARARRGGGPSLRPPRQAS